MKKKIACFLAFLMFFSALVRPVFARGVKEFGASLLLPTTGQTMNGDFYETKTKIMAGVEVVAVTSTIILATCASGGLFWLGLAPLIANHAWSATDAFKSARKPKNEGLRWNGSMTEVPGSIHFSKSDLRRG